MKPADKSPEMERFLENFSGRTTAIETDTCIPHPFGCGKSITPVGKVLSEAFRDDLSRMEYTISGLCQECQDAIFGV